MKKKPVSSQTCKNPFPKSLTKGNGVAQGRSPLIVKTTIPPINFKQPQMVMSKIPQPSAFKPSKLYPNKPQFSHIVSPISRYIKQTPTIPFFKSVKVNYDGGISKIYNSRDSDVSFKENSDEFNTSIALPSALPRHGKIGTFKKQVN